jgi:hypothetical protein
MQSWADFSKHAAAQFSAHKMMSKLKNTDHFLLTATLAAQGITVRAGTSKSTPPKADNRAWMRRPSPAELACGVSTLRK